MDFKIQSFVDHAAFFVRDIKWHISFFEEVLGMSVREIAGASEEPSQVWFNGGIQLVSAPDFEGPEGRMAHIGFMVENQSEVLDKAYARGVVELPKGRNWIKLPDGLCLEILQALPGSVGEYCKVKPR